MNSTQAIYDNADVQLIMAAQSELPCFSEPRAELAGQELFTPGFLSTLFAAERQAAHEAEELRAIESSMFPHTLPRSICWRMPASQWALATSAETFTTSCAGV